MIGRAAKNPPGHDSFDDDLLIKTREVLAVGDINDEFFSKLANNLLLLTQDSKSKPATIYLYSGGGDMYASCGLYDLIESVPYYIKVVVLGSACSGASYILQAADERLISKSSILMIHEWACSIDYNSSNIRAHTEINEVTFDKMTANYLKRAKIARDKFTENLKVDWFLTAEQAIEMGFADGYY